MTRRVLAARLDNAGDVLLAGPAVRAVAASGAEVVFLASPQGTAAAQLLPGVERVLTWRCPWIDATPDAVDRATIDAFVTLLAGLELDEALILTSFHQSPLPLALLLRMAGVQRITAHSDDYPGNLLDVRHRVDADVPEAERALAIAAAGGFALPADDDGRLAVRRPLPDVSPLVPAEPYVVLHPGASVPARAWSAERCAQAVQRLTDDGWPVLVTGGPGEEPLTASVAGAHGVDLGGRTTLAETAALLDGAAAVVVGNTGPAHLAAAVGTPVVSLFAPTVPAARWAPYGVPTVLLGDQHAPCRDSRAQICPVAGHPCLESVTADDVVVAVASLTAGDRERVSA